MDITCGRWVDLRAGTTLSKGIPVDGVTGDQQPASTSPSSGGQLGTRDVEVDPPPSISSSVSTASGLSASTPLSHGLGTMGRHTSVEPSLQTLPPSLSVVTKGSRKRALEEASSPPQKEASVSSRVAVPHPKVRRIEDDPDELCWYIALHGVDEDGAKNKEFSQADISSIEALK